MEYPNNSDAAKIKAPVEEKREVPKPQLSAPVKTKKKSALNKFGENLISEDAGSVKNHIWYDVVMPSLKRAISDAIKDGIDIILYGSAKRDGRRNGTRIDYGGYWDRRDPRRDDPPVRRSSADFDDIIFPSMADAEQVLDCLEDMLQRYKVVSVLDLYDIAQMTAPYTASRYGWKDIRGARARRVRDGWMLDLPRPMPLD